jgi:hypothetical protein
MYHLWWTRERVLYLGNPASEQRVIVLERAGLPLQTLSAANDIDTSWPSATRYSADGSEVALSYLKYLIIPRVPGGSEEYRLRELSGEILLEGAAASGIQHDSFQTIGATPRGLIVAAVVLLGIGLGLSRYSFTLPEGIAVASLISYAFTVAVKWSVGVYWPIGIGMVLAGIVGWMFFVRGALSPRGEPAPLNSRYFLNLHLLPKLLIGGALLWSFLMAVVVVPDDWDAWAQWGSKAKVLLLSTGPLSDVCYFVPGSADYPLLWPSLWAFAGWCAGGWEEQWGKGLGTVLLAATLGQIYLFANSISRRMDRGWWCEALMVSMPAVPLIASWSYAEPALWLMLICATTRLLKWRDSNRVADFWRAALFSAGAACTKNEGLLFCLLSASWVAFGSKNVLHFIRYLLPTLLLAGPWLVYVKFFVGSSSHVNPTLVAPLSDLNWWGQVLGSFSGYILGNWSDVKQWNMMAVGMILASLMLSLQGSARDRSNLLLPFSMLAGFMFVILTYGESWMWQLSVAWNRLTIQFLMILLPVLISGFLKDGPLRSSKECLSKQH